MTQKAFTLLECMIALLLVSTTLIIVVESQVMAVDALSQGQRRDLATTLARSLMTELEFQMEKEGFGTREVREQGNFNDDIYGGLYDDYRWEYEVEMVEMELPDFGELMGLAGEGSSELAESAGVNTGGAAPSNDLSMLSSLGLDLSFLTEQLGNVLREARVRVCYTEGQASSGEALEDCIEIISHLVNPTGQVTDNSEEDDDEAGDLGLSGSGGGVSP
ncbi:MAG: type II secretion system protein [Myxococcota bacterium]|nr:type II secretion system protein [Myxococcota bacterium]